MDVIGGMFKKVPKRKGGFIKEICVNCGMTVIDPSGRYEFGDMFDSGVAGAVYEVRDTKTGNVLAGKIYDPHYGKSEVQERRFLREADCLERLAHPNIVGFHDFIDVTKNGEGTMCIMIDYIDGECFFYTLRREKCLDDKKLAEITKQLARSLDHSHGEGILHRDVKSENIVMRKDGENVVLVDFGIAHVMTNDSGMIEGGREEVYVEDNPDVELEYHRGTHQYAAPESVGLKKQDHRTDLYSLGVIMYRGTMGFLPFDGEDSEHLLRRVASEEPLPFEVASKLVRRGRLPPSTLEPVVMKLLSKDPDDRYQSGEELCNGLDKALA